MPGRMLKRSKNVRPATRIVYENHKGNCGPAKNVEGIISLVQAMEFGGKILITELSSKPGKVQGTRDKAQVRNKTQEPKAKQEPGAEGYFRLSY